MRKTRQLLTMVVAGMLAGCQVLQPLVPPGPAAPSARGVVSATAYRGLVKGRADFPGLQRAQALPSEVVVGSTVSFFDATGTTIATGKTDAVGVFSLALGDFTPTVGATYVLEAVKGLNGNAPGSSAVRLRTLLQWDGVGWLSCTNGAVSGAIVLNAQTTALAIESALDPAAIPAAQTIGKVNAAVTPATFNAAPGPYADHPDAELVQLSNDLLASLGGNQDPIASVPAIKPTITGLFPTSGPVNALVQISGSGFNPVPAGNTVAINGAAAGVVLATPTQLVVTVGAGAAATGNVTVTTARGTATGGAFTRTAGGGGTAFWVDGFTPSFGRPGTPFTIAGQFAAIGATPSVSFVGLGGQTAYAPVSAFTASSITARVPVGALPGRVMVQANGTTSTSGTDFDVWQGDLSAMTSLANPTPVSTNYHFAAAWGARYGTARYAQYQYAVSSSEVWMTPLLPDGSIGAPRVIGKLQNARAWPSMVIYNRYLYVIGGSHGGAGTLIERATINDDGSLSAFKEVANLHGGRNGGASIVLAGVLYVLPGSLSGSLELWAIDSNTGDLTFMKSITQNYFGQAANTGYYGYSFAVRGNWVYFFAGYYNSAVGYTGKSFGLYLPGDGTVSDPYPGPTLPQGTYMSSCALAPVGSNADVYILGGYRSDTNTWGNPKIYRATWDFSTYSETTGYLGTFTEVGSLLGGGTPGYVFANGPNLYAVGGSNNSVILDYIQRATVNGSTLGAWSILQGTAIQGGSSVLLGSKAWTLGGSYLSSDANGNAVSNPSATTRYVTLNDDGSLGAAGAGPSLNAARGHAAAVATKDFVYVLGGGDLVPSFRASIERAPINPDGSLGAFMTLPQALSAARWMVAAVVYQDAIYCFGGRSHNGTTWMSHDTVERFSVNPDGTLGAGQVLPVRLPEELAGASPVVVGDSVYLVGGVAKYGYDGAFYPGASRHVLRARFNPDGSLSPFSDAGSLVMPTAFAVSALVGNYVYAFGGGQGSYTTDVQRAAVRPDGSLMEWQAYQSGSGTSVLSSPIYKQGGVLIRNNALYLPDSLGLVSTGRNLSCAFQYGTIR